MIGMQRNSLLVESDRKWDISQERVSVAEWFPIQHRITKGDRLEIDFGFRAQVRNLDQS